MRPAIGATPPRAPESGAPHGLVVPDRFLLQVSPQSSSISTVPYPIPPVGADPSTWHPDEEPPPLSFSVQLPERLLVPSAVRVGWWDASKQAWSEEGVSNVAYDAAAGRLSFSSVHIGCLALLHDTSAHLPYSAWCIRPSGGLGGSTAVIELQVPGLPAGDSSSTGSVSLEVGSGWVRLCGPCLPQLGHLLGKQLPPWALLAACEACGLKLAPSRRESLALGLPGKEAAAEQAMCADLASLCTRFLAASSRWNREAGQQVLLVRLSQVTDWEEGGRTSSHAAARIFSKEAVEGPWQVLIARREGTLGVGLVDGGDNQPTPSPGPDFSTVEAVQAAMQGEAGVMQASLLHLLDMVLGQQQQQQQQQEEEEAAQRDDAAAGVGVLQGSKSVDAGFRGSMVQLLQALRVFSCA